MSDLKLFQNLPAFLFSKLDYFCSQQILFPICHHISEIKKQDQKVIE
nr:MAG TPA: hypothetical protein [Caudoviricetes sp.]